MKFVHCVCCCHCVVPWQNKTFWVFHLTTEIISLGKSWYYHPDFSLLHYSFIVPRFKEAGSNFMAKCCSVAVSHFLVRVTPCFCNNSKMLSAAFQQRFSVKRLWDQYAAVGVMWPRRYGLCSQLYDLFMPAWLEAFRFKVRHTNKCTWPSDLTPSTQGFLFISRFSCCWMNYSLF